MNRRNGRIRGYGRGYGQLSGLGLAIDVGAVFAVSNLATLPEGAAVDTVVATLTVVNPEPGVVYTTALPAGDDGAWSYTKLSDYVFEVRVADSDLIVCPLVGYALEIEPGFALEIEPGFALEVA